jgi:hypothetical protein
MSAQSTGCGALFPTESEVTQDKLHVSRSSWKPDGFHMGVAIPARDSLDSDRITVTCQSGNEQPTGGTGMPCFDLLDTVTS